MRQYCTVNQREICRFPVNFTGPVFTKHIKVHCYTDCQKKKCHIRKRNAISDWRNRIV